MLFTRNTANCPAATSPARQIVSSSSSQSMLIWVASWEGKKAERGRGLGSVVSKVEGFPRWEEGFPRWEEGFPRHDKIFDGMIRRGGNELPKRSVGNLLESYGASVAQAKQFEQSDSSNGKTGVEAIGMKTKTRTFKHKKLWAATT